MNAAHPHGAKDRKPVGFGRLGLFSWACVVAVMALASAIASASGELSSYGYSRSAILGYPEEERRPIIEYLDAARWVADDVMYSFVRGRDEKLVGQLEALARPGQAIPDFIPGFAFMREKYGKMTSYVYLGQALESLGGPPDVHDLTRATSMVYYHVRTEKRQDMGLFVAVRTARRGSKHYFYSLQFLDFAEAVPAWLQVGGDGLTSGSQE